MLLGMPFVCKTIKVAVKQAIDDQGSWLLIGTLTDFCLPSHCKCPLNSCSFAKLQTFLQCLCGVLSTAGNKDHSMVLCFAGSLAESQREGRVCFVWGKGKTKKPKNPNPTNKTTTTTPPQNPQTPHKQTKPTPKHRFKFLKKSCLCIWFISLAFRQCTIDRLLLSVVVYFSPELYTSYFCGSHLIWGKHCLTIHVQH